MDDAALRRACDRVLDDVAADPRYAHTSHLLVRRGGTVLVDEHLRGPLSAPVFSVTKSIVATALGAMAERHVLPPLDSPLSAVVPHVVGTPAETHTWDQVLSMTRGARVDGPWDGDAVALLPRGQVHHIASAPQVTPPGARFVYDDPGVHLLSAAATAILGEPLADFARRAVLDPIGASSCTWPSDPDGISWGSSGVEITAADLSLIGQLWLDGGRHRGRRLVNEQFLTAMTTPHSRGGPPEDQPYGYLVWLPPEMLLAGGWAGQHMLVIPGAGAVIVTTGDPGFDLGPPPRDDLPADWRPALDLVRRHLLPVLTGGPAPPAGTRRPGA